MQQKSFRFRIYPTLEQEKRLREYAGASRFVYNLALEQRRDWWRQFKAANGRAINWASQSAELTEARNENSWLAAVPRSILEQALRDLDKAYTAFFAGRGGYPGFRSADANMGFRVQGRDVVTTALNAKWAAIRLPKCEPIKLRLTRPIVGSIRNVAVRFVAGSWYASFASETAVDSVPSGLPPVGIDRGIAAAIALSNGEMHILPCLAVQTQRRKAAQRVLARRKKGSKRRRDAKAELNRRTAAVAAIRSHWLHERSADIASRFGAVILEDLNVAGMTCAGKGKAGLNRSILNQGWSIFARMLEYKLAARGGAVEYVNPAYTSQTCSACGSVARESRESQASFNCIDCGHRAHADTNAAINILRRSPAWQRVEEAGYGPVEARTGLVREHHENLAA